MARVEGVDLVGTLIRESHRSLREDDEVSCPELNAVVDILDGRARVHGCRMVGGGRGGSVAALVDPDATAAVVAEVERGYRARSGIADVTHVFETADGLRVVD